jgi:hypothetical protein
MPANQSLGFDDDQGLFLIAEARPEDKRETGRLVQSSRSDFSLLIKASCFRRNRASALRDVRKRNRRRKKRSPSATRSVIKKSRESSEHFVFWKNRNMGCQNGTVSAR